MSPALSQGRYYSFRAWHATGTPRTHQPFIDHGIPRFWYNLVRVNMSILMSKFDTEWCLGRANMPSTTTWSPVFKVSIKVCIVGSSCKIDVSQATLHAAWWTTPRKRCGPVKSRLDPLITCSGSKIWILLLVRRRFKYCNYVFLCWTAPVTHSYQVHSVPPRNSYLYRDRNRRCTINMSAIP